MKKAVALLGMLLVSAGWLAAQVSLEGKIPAVRRELKPQPAVSFSLSPNQPKFSHKFSVSKPGNVTVAIRWSPNDVQLTASLMG
jgi:hypothetical protein